MGLVERLKARKRFVKKVPVKFDLGGNELVDVGLLALTDAEEAAADVATEEFFGSKEVSRDSDEWTAERAVQILALAIVDPGEKAPTPCMTVDEVRQLFAGSEIGYLSQEYNVFCEAVRPDFDTLTDEQYEAIVAEVKKNPGLAITFGWHMLVRCIRFMAEQPGTSPTTNSSTTSP